MSRDEREVCFLIGEGDVVLWSDASTSPVALPDSRVRWEAIWSRRDRLVEIAHTHPLGGARFSNTDETTMVALDTGLGRRLVYSVGTPDSMLRRTPTEDGAEEGPVDDEPWWTELIRVASRIRSEPEPVEPAEPADPADAEPRTGESTSNGGK
jgi:hypothetical protein